MSTADVLEKHRHRFRVRGLSADSNWEVMHQLCQRLRPERVALEQEAAAAELEKRLQQDGLHIAVDAGSGAGARLAAGAKSECVIAAVTGVAGLPALRCAVRAGARILLANKEALVVGGPLLLREAAANGAELIPLDSEHNAVHQCLGSNFRAGVTPEGVSKVVLTASGGPFLRMAADELPLVTPAQAVMHPNWEMGAKISVDSATLMNKGLELIEASLLFALPPEQLQVLVHPQSLVHALVYFTDGSVLAQMANPDMRVPIAHALGCPQRLETDVPPLDLANAASLQFEEADTARFPCLRLARQALVDGGVAPVILNAANEHAVQAFLAGRLGFTEIAEIVERALREIPALAPQNGDNFDDLLALDCEVRARISRWLDVGSEPQPSLRAQ